MIAKHETEDAAIIAAKKLGKTDCQIVESKGDFYLETKHDISMIRSWERLVYSGPANKAAAKQA